MSRLTKHLAVQYANQDNLQIRIQTHQTYTEPKETVSWGEKIANQISWRGDEVVIDAGCGTGAHAAPTLARADKYIATDLSFGMVHALDFAVPKVNLNVEAMPFKANCADVILAHHMLYHVPDQQAAVSHFHRLLKPGGILMAATNSKENGRGIYKIGDEAARRLGLGDNFMPESSGGTFRLEEGGLLFEELFAVERIIFNSEFLFPESTPLLAYMNSMADWYGENLPPAVSWETFLDEVAVILDEILAEHGEIRISKKAGLFVCRKAG